jgi:FkbM family methyltransferase
MLRLKQRAKLLKRRLFPLDSFLRRVPGVIHVGANTGQEREVYASHGLNVLWVEPIPTTFEILVSNITTLSNQRACRYLLTNRDGMEVNLHVANNDGQSSSILGLAKHRALWPDVDYTHDIKMTSITLERLIELEGVDLNKYGALVLDTQGSELMVLEGGRSVLRSFRFVKTEVADFEAYAGCCQLSELTDFMKSRGFSLTWKYDFAARTGVGSYYDVLFKRLD